MYLRWKRGCVKSKLIGKLTNYMQIFCLHGLNWSFWPRITHQGTGPVPELCIYLFLFVLSFNFVVFVARIVPPTKGHKLCPCGGTEKMETEKEKRYMQLLYEYLFAQAHYSHKTKALAVCSVMYTSINNALQCLLKLCLVLTTSSHWSHWQLIL